MKIAIIGYGEEGQAAEAYFKAKNSENQFKIIRDYHDSDYNPADFADFDLVLRSPSVPPRPEFFSVTRYFFDHCPAPIIGVTGTKGKGTTCSMIADLLKSLGHRVHLVGNIGVPAISHLDKIQKDDVVVYEMSSFQLWDLEKSPHIAVVLRIEPDHLNVHKDFADYVNAKSHIAEFQTPDDSIIYFQNNPHSVEIAQKSPGKQIPYPLEITPDNSAELSGATPVDAPKSTNSTPVPPRLPELLDALTVPGQHNRENAEAALLAVAAFLDLSLEQLISDHFEPLRQALADFQGLPHHIEYVRTLHGVDYYDDSFSTSEPALEVALKTFANRPLFLIAGGQDKGVDYTSIQRLIFDSPNLEKAFLIGEIASKLAAGQPEDRFILAESLESAVQTAQKLAENLVKSPTPDSKAQLQGSPEQTTRPNHSTSSTDAPEQTTRSNHSTPVVLLSPGAASLDMFKSYYERGDQFQRLVQALK